MWKKVLFVGIAIVIGIGVFFLGYRSNYVNHIYKLVGDAIDESRYSDVAKVFGGCFDTESIIKDNSDDYDIVIYPGTTLTDSVNYGEEENYYHYRKAYYFYIFKMKFTTAASSTGTQKTGFRFYSDSESYNFYFTVNSDTNSSYYVSNPSNLEEVLLNSEHMSLTSGDIKFVNLTLSDDQINMIETKLGGKINKMAILDSLGDEVDSFPISLNFEEAFFKDADEFITAFDKQVNDNKPDDYDEIESNWEALIKSDDNTYTNHYSDDILSPKSLIWRTVGILALYSVVMVLFFILIFHFKSIKRIFSRENYKDYGSRRQTTYVNGKEQSNKDKNVIDAKPNKEKKSSKNTKKPTNDEALKEEPVEEIKETKNEGDHNE